MHIFKSGKVTIIVDNILYFEEETDSIRIVFIGGEVIRIYNSNAMFKSYINALAEDK